MTPSMRLRLGSPLN